MEKVHHNDATGSIYLLFLLRHHNVLQRQIFSDGLLLDRLRAEPCLFLHVFSVLSEFVRETETNRRQWMPIVRAKTTTD